MQTHQGYRHIPKHCDWPIIQGTHSSHLCKTRNLVYLIMCRKYSKQYVGETGNALHICFNGHRSDVKTRKMEKPVAAHFNLPGHSMGDLVIMVIEKIWRENTQLREEERATGSTTSYQ